MTTNEAIVDAQDKIADPSSDPQRWWVAPLVAIAAVAGVVIGSLYIYHQNFAPRPLKFAVLDLHYIVDAKEIEFTSMLASPTVSDDDRKKAMDLVAGIEPQLKQVLAQVRAECECEILVKAAALSSSKIPDITKQVAELMAINAESVAKAKERIRQNINGNTAK